MGIDIKTIFDIESPEEQKEKEELKQEPTNENYNEIIEKINELELKIKNIKNDERKTFLYSALILTLGTWIANTFGVELNLMENPENYLLAGTFLIGGALISDAVQAHRITEYNLKPELKELYEDLYEELNKKEINRKGIKKLSRKR